MQCFEEEHVIPTLVETQAFVIFSRERKNWENGEVRSALCIRKEQELFICLLFCMNKGGNGS